MNNTHSSEWEAVIGLEIHIELNTKTKIFSPAPNHFGDEPNANIHAVCTGQPGALPVLNKAVVDKAIAVGCALNSTVAHYSKFDRKSYFYPDSPRNFQITQYDQPIVIGGQIQAEMEDGSFKVFQINRAHLEDDAGMLKHFTSFAGVDYNRAGVPLIEIVSEPCMRSAQDASAYAMAIRSVMQYIDVSDCNMEEGSLRMDANISVRKKGDTELRPKIEVKNMNSFRNLELAINTAIEQQIQAYTKHPTLPFDEVIESGTYRWDAENNSLVLMRKKERADDYCYFPEPDLPPIRLTQEYIDSIREKLPELPQAKKQRYINELNLSVYNAAILSSDYHLARYFEEGLTVCPNASGLCNWITVEFAGRFKDKGIPVYNCGIPSAEIAELVNMIGAGTITGKIAKEIADDLVASPDKTCKQIIAENPNYQVLNDTNAIEKAVEKILSANPQSVADYKAGKSRALGFLVGQVMKETGGKAPPQLVNDLIHKHIR